MSLRTPNMQALLSWRVGLISEASSCSRGPNPDVPEPGAPTDRGVDLKAPTVSRTGRTMIVALTEMKVKR